MYKSPQVKHIQHTYLLHGHTFGVADDSSIFTVVVGIRRTTHAYTVYDLVLLPIAANGT